MKKFSIIIPAYNVEKYIKECLNSICIQDFDNYEIIIVNDNSQDITAHKIIEFQKEHPNIRIKSIYNEKNLGAGASRNIGIQNADGEYILFIDSDDYLSCENVLSSIACEMENNNADVLIFGSVINYKDNKDTSIKTIPLIPKNKEEKKRYQLTKKIIRFVWPLCIRKELIDTYNIRFQEDIDLYEDTIFRTQAMACANKIKTYSKVCYNYNRRLNATSLSSNSNSKIVDKLGKLVKATRRINELANSEEIPQEQVGNFRKTMMLFFPGVLFITGNHLLSKIATKISNKHYNSMDEER